MTCALTNGCDFGGLVLEDQQEKMKAKKKKKKKECLSTKLTYLEFGLY